MSEKNSRIGELRIKAALGGLMAVRHAGAYRFQLEGTLGAGDFHADSGLMTVSGIKAAELWLAGYLAGRQVRQAELDHELFVKRMDELCTRHTAFSNFEHMVSGCLDSYRPSLNTSGHLELEELARGYDDEQRVRGDKRRAYRY